MSDSPKRVRVTHRNGLRQTWVKGAEVAEGNPTRKRGGTLKMSAAATRAIARIPAEERAKVATEAAEAAASDDRAIRGMVWDCHVALAYTPEGAEPVPAVRPGVASDEAMGAWRRAMGIGGAAVASPAAR
jgi:hypothetical protein